jgi:sortase A
MRTENGVRKFFASSHPFLRWTSWILFVAGALAVGFVALALLSASAFQERARNSLQKQIVAQQDQRVDRPRTVAKEGDVLGRIEIPRLGMMVAILEGTTTRTLRLGVGHIDGTALPGESGNTGIAGHRDTYFRPLKDIRQGDEIQIQTATGLSRYTVDWVKIVTPDDTGILAPAAESSITLVTCYPFYFLGAAPKRFIVHASKE